MRLLSGLVTCLAFASACGHGSVINGHPRAGSLANNGAPSAAPPRTAKVHPDFKRLMAQAPDEYRGILFWTQITLARFGYLTRPFTGRLDGRTVDAILAYRRDAHVESDYLIDKSLFDRIRKDSQDLEDPTWLPNRFFLNLATLVTASGTWVGVGERFAYEFNHVEIKCHLLPDSRAYCAEAEAHMGTDGESLDTTVRLHEVETWTATEIVTAPQQALCAKDFIRINLVTEEVTRTRVTTNMTDPDCARVMTGSDFTMRLEDGENIWRSARARRDAAYTRVLGLPLELFTEKKRARTK